VTLAESGLHQAVMPGGPGAERDSASGVRGALPRHRCQTPGSSAGPERPGATLPRLSRRGARLLRGHMDGRGSECSGIMLAAPMCCATVASNVNTSDTRRTNPEGPVQRDCGMRGDEIPGAARTRGTNTPTGVGLGGTVGERRCPGLHPRRACRLNLGPIMRFAVRFEASILSQRATGRPMRRCASRPALIPRRRPRGVSWGRDRPLADPFRVGRRPCASAGCPPPKGPRCR
jgi:hypothetical protein